MLNIIWYLVVVTVSQCIKHCEDCMVLESLDFLLDFKFLYICLEHFFRFPKFLSKTCSCLDLLRNMRKQFIVYVLQVSPHKRGIRNGPKALKPIPVIVRCK